MSRQNSEMLRNKERDSDRRSRIIQAIEKRKAIGSKVDIKREETMRKSMALFSNKVNIDPVIKPSEQNLASLYKSKALLDNPNLPITPQVLSDAEQDIASALTLRGQGATEGKIHRGELITMNRMLGEWLQKYGNNPQIDLRKQDPSTVAMIVKLNEALIDDYHETIKARKNYLLDEQAAIYGDNDEQFNNIIGRMREQFNKAHPQGELKPKDIFKIDRKTGKKNKKVPGGWVEVD
jgi:hypothetical protein